MNEIEDKIKKIIDGLDLNECESTVLQEIAIDPCGLPINTAYSMIIKCTGILDDVENQKIITELLSRKYIHTKTDNELEYFVPDYKKIGIPSDLCKQIHNLNKVGFNIIGHPHSGKGMQTLNDLFFQEKDRIYISLGVTNVNVFKTMLENRIKYMYYTTFYYPKPNQNKDINKKERLEWEKYLNNLPKDQKKYVEFKIVNKNYDFVYTTALSKGKARFNFRELDKDLSTRKGTIIEINSNNSGYKILDNIYADLNSNSYPDFFISPFLFIKYFTLKNILTIMILILSLVLLFIKTPLTQYVLGLFSGVITKLIFNLIERKQWAIKKLF